ncbi:MAG TPA: PPOX class F420-dependent oxidoreductase [Ktedonobacterales bacterium]
MNRREQIAMTPDEIRAFLVERRIASIATNGRDGFPHVVAMWYVPRDQTLAFWTYAKSQKAVNLRRDPHLTYLVEAGEDYGELRGVQIKGHAQISDDPAQVQQLGEELWRRYSSGGELSDAMRAMIAAQARKRIAVLVQPVDVASWDHRKLGGVY